MKLKQFEAVLIMLVTGTLLALFSYLKPAISFPLFLGETIDVRFIPFEKLLTLGGFATSNVKADSIAEKLLQTDYKDSISSDSVVVPEFLTVSSLEGVGALDDFFAALKFESPEKVVRIAHYGDSQIEGDRITSNIRDNFFKEFGGQGVGFVPFDDIATNVSYSRESSSNWKRFSVFHDKLKNGAFGLSGMSFIYRNSITPVENDSVAKTVEKLTASIRLRLRSNYSKIKIQYGNASSPCHVSVYKTGSDNVLGKTVLNQNISYVEQEIDLTANEKNITLSFEGESPMIYGITFDGEKGVQVDNFGIRGHSGNGLLKIEKSLFSDEIKQSNTRLIMLQFGANTIPYVNSQKTLDYVASEFSRIFKKFKQVNKNLSVLVIGVGDMATRIDGEYTSYPMIPDIRDVIKKAALESGCAYFDMYEYMGGKDAILSWSKKGLASKDGHFSPKGQRIVADQIFNAILTHYKQFEKKISHTFLVKN